MKFSIKFLLIASFCLPFVSCNEEEVNSLREQNENLQNQMDTLIAAKEAQAEQAEEEKEGLLAEASNLKAKMEKDYVSTSKHAIALKKVESYEKEKQDLEKEKRDLTKKLDELMNGAERLLALAEKDFAKKNYKSAKEKLTDLLAKHPDYSKNKKVADLTEKIAKQEALTETGNWSVGFLKDEFGEETNEGYVALVIDALMSNTAVANAPSEITIRAEKDSIIFLLYPYGNDRNETWSRTQYWTWKVQDGEKVRHTLRGKTGAEAMLFMRVGDTSFTALQKLLMKGGELKFIGSYDRTEWKFTISNADGFEKAWETMMAQAKQR